MDKPFRSIEQQVRLLQGRGVTTDAETPTVLLREGYYAVVNGYGKAFLDQRATARAGDDRYRRGTTFADMYRLFLFDRELRALTFRAIMSVEGTLRAILSHTFCKHHRNPEAYLNRHSYAPAAGYLRGEGVHAGDLEWMISTLRHHAAGHAIAERTEDESVDADMLADDVRVAWYRENHDAIPLWVLFSDLTFGNLRYFYALMRRDEQVEVCAHLCEACGTTLDGRVLEPDELLHDLETLSELRNDCAHVERIYDGHFGEDELSYLEVLDILAAFLAEHDERALYAGVRRLTERTAQCSDAVAGALQSAGFI